MRNVLSTVADCHRSREHRREFQVQACFLWSSHFLNREATDKAMGGEELSLKAFLAGEQETGLGVPHWQFFFCCQIRASQEKLERLK